MVIDDEVATIGTTNIDVRSFSLNFEINALVYVEAIAIECRKLFELDQEGRTPELYEQRGKWTNVREAVLV